jgi:hypothetical protein
LAKIILLITLCLGAGFYFPSTRPTLQEVFAPIINPALSWQSRNEMSQVTKKLQLINREGQLLPAPGKEFLDWMVRNFQGSKARDAWGNEYTLTTWSDSVAVVSRGPDLEARTIDDFKITARIQRERRRR